MATRSRLQKELGQKKPFRSRNQEAAIAIVRTADLLKREFTAAVEPFGLTVQQYNVLRILRGALPERLPTMEIAERMIEKTPGITGLLDRLEEKQLVQRERDADDRRCSRCVITPKGLDLLGEMEETVTRADERVLSMLEGADVAGLIRILDEVRARYDR
jgi:DNA-binding MarR family transcriptional regulator